MTAPGSASPSGRRCDRARAGRPFEPPDRGVPATGFARIIAVETDDVEEAPDEPAPPRRRLGPGPYATSNPD